MATAQHPTLSQGNLYLELLFESHDNLDKVERISLNLCYFGDLCPSQIRFFPTKPAGLTLIPGGH